MIRDFLSVTGNDPRILYDPWILNLWRGNKKQWIWYHLPPCTSYTSFIDKNWIDFISILVCSTLLTWWWDLEVWRDWLINGTILILEKVFARLTPKHEESDACYTTPPHSSSNHAMLGWWRHLVAIYRTVRWTSLILWVCSWSEVKSSFFGRALSVGYRSLVLIFPVFTIKYALCIPFAQPPFFLSPFLQLPFFVTLLFSLPAS